METHRSGGERAAVLYCASGSSTISARLFAPAGTLLHWSGGGVFAPSQVYWSGICPRCANADELSLSVIRVPPCGP